MVNVTDRDTKVTNIVININSLFGMFIRQNETLKELLMKGRVENLSEDEKKEIKLNFKNKYWTYLKQVASEMLEENTRLFEEIRQFQVVKKNRKDFLQEPVYDNGIVLFNKYVQLFPDLVKKISPETLIEVSLLMFNVLCREYLIPYSKFLKECDPEEDFFYFSNKGKKYEKEWKSFFEEFMKWESSLPLRMHSVNWQLF
ncbi:hypothetical protein J4423_00650 [Candidatus Pacearchaeota archaeon]|nr:hypothetical protein [Candidatus Pacearchaeota archaeon]